jgi:hypothetical protein
MVRHIIITIFETATGTKNFNGDAMPMGHTGTYETLGDRRQTPIYFK